jgi:hypothetical protein
LSFLFKGVTSTNFLITCFEALLIFLRSTEHYFIIFAPTGSYLTTTTTNTNMVCTSDNEQHPVSDQGIAFDNNDNNNNNNSAAPDSSTGDSWSIMFAPPIRTSPSQQVEFGDLRDTLYLIDCALAIVDGVPLPNHPASVSEAHPPPTRQ